MLKDFTADMTFPANEFSEDHKDQHDSPYLCSFNYKSALAVYMFLSSDSL